MSGERVRVAVVAFTRDLRVHDNPVLAGACAAAELVAPLFVLDPVIERLADSGHNRGAFLAECLADLNASLRALGGRLIVRRGDPVEQVARLAERVCADQVHLARDVSGYAARREHRLRAALAEQRRELVVHDGVHTVVPPGQLTPPGSDHYSVFTPYWRRWAEVPRRRPADPPTHIRLPRVAAGRLPAVQRTPGPTPPGGETAARERAASWLADGVHRYHETRDVLAADATSRLSPYLHLGCLSALELATGCEPGGPSAGPAPGAAAFVRQLAWRDFHAQVLAARRDAAHQDYRPRGDRWRTDPDALAAWRAGQTGYPIVDAGMRQLCVEGWMHNRARLIAASFLTKTLYLDWRVGAAHFASHLIDCDVANNNLNWQWVAGTGTDTRPNRVLNPLRQGARYDPDGQYVRRWIPELADVSTTTIHRPWRSSGTPSAYPAPIVDLDHARDRFHASRPSRAMEPTCRLEGESDQQTDV